MLSRMFDPNQGALMSSDDRLVDMFPRLKKAGQNAYNMMYPPAIQNQNGMSTMDALAQLPTELVGGPSHTVLGMLNAGTAARNALMPQALPRPFSGDAPLPAPFSDQQGDDQQQQPSGYSPDTMAAIGGLGSMIGAIRRSPDFDLSKSFDAGAQSARSKAAMDNFRKKMQDGTISDKDLYGTLAELGPNGMLKAAEMISKRRTEAAKTNLSRGTQTQFQTQVGNIDAMIPLLQDLKNAAPSQMGGQFVHPYDQINYQNKVNSLADTIVKAYGLPKTDQSIEIARNMLRRKWNQTDAAYAQQIENVIQDALTKRQIFSQALGQGNVAANPPSGGATMTYDPSTGSIR